MTSTFGHVVNPPGLCVKNRLELVYRPAAVADLDGIYDYIAADHPDRALSFVAEIRARCRPLTEFPELGVARPDLGHEIRIYPMRRRVIVAYRYTTVQLVITRVFYGGQDYETILRSGDDGFD